ncbi:MAG: PilN domain-containing protein [Deltaproteobacteria bacterium]|nr:PilN domain-containing protein [Deltaproteobacteria bacterium]
MIRINLLPFRAARKRENIRKQVTVSALIVVFFILLMVYFFIQISGDLSTVKEQENEKRQELATYQKTLNEIKKLEKQIKEIETKLNVIRELEKGKTGPVKLLDEIAEAVPRDKLWLKTLDENQGTLRMTGTAMDNETVALFMDNLKNSEHIISVELQGVTLRDLPEYRLKVSDFGLDCKTYAHADQKAAEPAKTAAPKKRR